MGRIGYGDRELVGTAPEAYGLVPGERLTDHVTRSWNRLTGVWANFSTQLAVLSKSERTATSLTRERWLRPLFDELGFGGLSPATPVVVDGKEYALSHQWGESVPMHLLGARLPIDRRSPGVPGAATSSPHGLVQEFLNRSDEHLWAVVTNGLVLRLLRDNASLTRQAYVEFDLQAIFDGESFSEFALLWLVVHRSRFEGDIPEKCVLEQWTSEAATAGTRALEGLRASVESAIEMLGAGFLSHAANSSLRRDLESGALSTDDYQRQLLRVVYRLLFLMIAESRDLLLDPSAEEMAKLRYQQFYSMDRLVRLAEVRRGSAHDDLWQGVTLITNGLSSQGLPALALTPLGSFLWSEDSTPALTGARLSNRSLLGALRSLTIIADREAGVHRRIDYRNLGAEELGSVYESLLELHANVDIGARTFELDTAAGNERKTTGSYYTPTPLITELLNSALEPVLDEAAAAPDPEAAILALSILDPACGSGHFLIAAANRIAHRLATIRAEGIEPAPDQVRTALRDVVGSCIYGIDINPMAVELCKISLWIEAMDPVRPLSFLDHRIVCGNALLGTTPRLLAEGLPDDAFKAITGDDKAVVSALKARNKGERAGQGTLDLGGTSVADLVMPFAAAIAEIEHMPDTTVADIDAKRARLAKLRDSDAARRGRLAADAWCAGIVAPKAKGEPPITTATVRQAGDNPSRLDSDVLQRIDELAVQYQFLHLHLAFPDVFRVPEDGTVATNQRTGWSGGFSCVLGNPPWERVKVLDREWFATSSPEIASAANASVRERLINDLVVSGDATDEWMYRSYQRARRVGEAVVLFANASGRYPLMGTGDVDTYRLFAESAFHDCVGSSGYSGMVLPTGVVMDLPNKEFSRSLLDSFRLRVVLDFSNQAQIFKGIGGNKRFCLLVVGPTSSGNAIHGVSQVRRVAELRDSGRYFEVTASELLAINPLSASWIPFVDRRAAQVISKIYQGGGGSLAPGREDDLFRPRTMHHMSGTSDRFHSEPGPGRVPLYEAKLFGMHNDRFATFEGVPQSARGGTKPKTLRLDDAALADPDHEMEPRYWLSADDPDLRLDLPWLLVYRNTVSAVADARSMLASLIPSFGLGHSATYVESLTGNADALKVLAAWLNSHMCDFVLRNKLAGSNVSQFVFRQLPAIPTGGPMSQNELIESVTRLSASSRFMSTALGETAPILWNSAERAGTVARIDAHFAIASRPDASGAQLCARLV